MGKRDKKQGDSSAPVAGDGVPDGAMDVRVTSVSEGRKNIQITVAYRNPNDGKRKSVTLHLRRHASRWEDRFGRAWAPFTGPQDLPPRPKTKTEIKAEAEKSLNEGSMFQ